MLQELSYQEYVQSGRKGRIIAEIEVLDDPTMYVLVEYPPQDA